MCYLKKVNREVQISIQVGYIYITYSNWWKWTSKEFDAHDSIDIKEVII